MHDSEVMFSSSPQIDTADVDEAEDVLSRVYLPVKLAPSVSAPIKMRLSAEEFPLLTAGYLQFGSRVCIAGDEVPAYYIEAPLSGRAVNQWRDGHVEVTGLGSVAIFTPGMPVDLDWSGDCGQVCLKVTEAQMQRQLEAMLGRHVGKRVTFARRLTVNTAASRDWFGLVHILTWEAGRSDGVLGHPLAAENLQRLLIQGLLLLQPHNYAEELRKGERAGSAAGVKRAIDLIHAHPEAPWSTGELARATGMSASALQRAFQRAGQPPPMTYLRRLRLRRAHEELAASPPDGVTVSSVAGRWGFLHLGRFAEQYRQEFGESPSDTLRTGSAQRCGVRL